MPDRLAPNPSGPQAGSPRKGLALRFISGKYQGGEFPIEEGRQIIIGRSSDLDMVLVEEMVSRRHAQIEMRNGVITIQDMGSTNGTFVEACLELPGAGTQPCGCLGNFPGHGASPSRTANDPIFPQWPV